MHIALLHPLIHTPLTTPLYASHPPSPPSTPPPSSTPLHPPQDERRYIVYDGDVDALWVENMNSVMDDNKLLTLPNGERIRLNFPTCSMLFEVFDLQYASPGEEPCYSTTLLYNSTVLRSSIYNTFFLYSITTILL